jgi:hypothetical protein
MDASQVLAQLQKVLEDLAAEPAASAVQG